MIPQLNKITHTKKVAALSIVIVVSFSYQMERVGRVELRDLQLGRLLVAPSPVYPQYSNYTTNIIACLRCLAEGIGIEPATNRLEG